MPTIAHVTESLGGGVLNVLLKLLSDQVTRGDQVFLIYSRRLDTPTEIELDRLLPPNLTRICIPMITKPSLGYDIGSTIVIRGLLKQIKPDVLHAHSSKAGALARAAALFLPCRVFYTPHGYSFVRRDVSPFKRALFWGFEAAGGLLGGQVLACSISEKTLARRLPRWRKVVLVQNGVDDVVCKLYYPSIKTSRRPMVVAVGRLSPQKAPFRFFELAKRFPNVDFVWVGDGELNPGSTLPSENLRITGWLEKTRVLEILIASDVYCMLSLWEGLPLALLEAMLIGIPTVVSDIGGCRETVSDSLTGFVCDDLESASSKLRQLLGDSDLAMRMGKASRMKALAHYSSERMCQDAYAAYFS